MVIDFAIQFLKIVVDKKAACLKSCRSVNEVIIIIERQDTTSNFNTEIMKLNLKSSTGLQFVKSR